MGISFSEKQIFMKLVVVSCPGLAGWKEGVQVGDEGEEECRKKARRKGSTWSGRVSRNSIGIFGNISCSSI